MTKRESTGSTRRQPTSSENPPQAQESNFWTTGKGVLTIIGIAVAATVVVMALIFSTLDRDNEFGQPAVYTDEQTDSVCGLGGVAREGSIADTPDAEWIEYRGAWLPTSETYGPGLYDTEGEFRCFERSPRGMLFAASAYTGQLTNPSYWEAEPEIFAGQYAAEHQEEATELFTTVFSEADTALGGFRLVHYDGETAQIDMAVTSFDGSETSRTSVVLDLVWADGDWHIDATEPELGITLTPLSDLIGYQHWSA
ncbi:hypothetical protein GCM10023190_23780 [Enteractinococcus fodinae]|uniref:DUF8175 domain-containing protein n=1 Tax=Enteractinococcus fodinae TaxID=684663 RepID=A0ABU2B2M3_9MICC|nr:hypothetical protein [Enteractinococcus fodinae]MDR7347858.1 hypothetical protein [Enteractinococcus fodinae]